MPTASEAIALYQQSLQISESIARISHKQCDSYGALRYRNLYNPYRETVSGIFHGVDF